jgi:hypothetical protein
MRITVAGPCPSPEEDLMSAPNVSAPHATTPSAHPLDPKHVAKPAGASFESLVNNSVEKKSAGPVTPAPRSYETI